MLAKLKDNLASVSSEIPSGALYVSIVMSFYGDHYVQYRASSPHFDLPYIVQKALMEYYFQSDSFFTKILC